MSSDPKPKRTITTRKHHSPEVWAQARRDYLAGFTAAVVCARYDMTVDALRKRASKEKWKRRRGIEPSPR